MTLTESMELLDWTRRQLKPRERGAMPKNASPIVDRLNLSAELWLHTVEYFRQTPLREPYHSGTGFSAMAKPALK